MIEKVKLLIELIGILIWPTVVVGIVLMFRKQIIRRLDDVRKFKGAGIEVTFEKKIEGLIDEAMEDIKLKEADTPAQFKEMIAQPDKADEGRQEGTQTLLAFTCGVSYNENLKYNIYYDPVKRNHNAEFKYIGLYTNKAVVAVGELKKIVCCDLKDGKLVATEEEDLSKLTDDEYRRIKETIENTDYYDLEEGNKFYLVDKFYKTNFGKKSDYAIRAKKYFWLDEIEGFRKGMTAKELADLLDGREWE